jgi:hypothetical protein
MTNRQVRPYPNIFSLALVIASHTCASALLQLNGTRPRFGWIDPTVDPPSFRTYSHWGTNATTNLTEPQEQRPPENCGAARFGYSFDTPSAWGWADEPCNATYIFMCRITRECMATQ